MRLDELPGRLKLPTEVLAGGGPLLDGGGWEDNLVFATD